MPNFNWPIPTSFPLLEKQDAHIWCVALDCDEDQLSELFTLLDEDEQSRAKRFHFKKDRDHFVASHGILRKILSGYLGVAPIEIIFSYNSFGKPFLANESKLQFNLSHANNIALIAVALDVQIGIDIEDTSRQCDMDEIAQRFFSKNEALILKELEGTEKIKAFFNGWTRKEAFLKAHGQGLSYSLENVEVTLQANESAEFVAIHDESENLSEWLLYALDPLIGYAAALAVKGSLQTIKTLQWRSNII